MTNFTQKFVSYSFNSLYKKLGDNTLNPSDFVESIIRAGLNYPVRKKPLLVIAIKDLEHWLSSHKRRCPESGNCHQDILFESVITNFKLEQANDKTLIKDNSIEDLIYKDIILGFESLLDDYSTNHNSRVNEKDFSSHVIGLIGEYPTHKELVTKSAFSDMNFILHTHHFECPHFKANESEKCRMDNLLNGSIRLINNQLEEFAKSIPPELNVVVTPEIQAKEKYYVNEARIKELRDLKNESALDLDKLIQLCKELNDNWNNENYYSVIADVRMIIHYVAPIFGEESFKAVHANFEGGGSFKKICKRLLDFVDIADIHAHQRAIHKDPLPTENTVQHLMGDLNQMLSRCITELSNKNLKPKEAKT